MRVQRQPSELAETMLKIAGSQDAKHLREFLQGRSLPASGGDLSPADIIYRSCEEVDDRLDWDGLARALATVITELGVAARTKPLDTKQAYLLRNALDLAAELRPNQDLGAALDETPGTSVHGRGLTHLFLPFLRATVFHQHDDRHEDDWLGLIESVDETVWSDRTPSEVRTILLTTWRGLLWIPTTNDRSVVDFDRVDRGLVALSRSVEKRFEARKLLVSALGILQETYPRSAEFWEEHLAPYAEHWPPILREVAHSQWPGLGAPRQRRRLAG